MKLKNGCDRWQDKRVILLSSEPSSLRVHLTDFLSKMGWRVGVAVPELKKAIAAFKADEGSVIFVDSCEGISSTSAYRRLLHTHMGCLIPTILIVPAEHLKLLDFFTKFDVVKTVEKPLTKGNLLEAFIKMTDAWSQGYLDTLRKAFKKSVLTRQNMIQEVIKEQIKSDQLTPLANSAMSLMFRKKGNLEIAEKLLLQPIKLKCFHPQVVLPLLDIYMNGGEPAKALQLIAQVNKVCNHMEFICPDAVQAHLMLNQPKECIPYLNKMLRNDYYPEIAKAYLPRLYFSTGELVQFEKSILHIRELFEQHQEAWQLLNEEDTGSRLKFCHHEFQKANLPQQDLAAHKSVIKPKRRKKNGYFPFGTISFIQQTTEEVKPGGKSSSSDQEAS